MSNTKVVVIVEEGRVVNILSDNTEIEAEVIDLDIQDDNDYEEAFKQKVRAEAELKSIY